MKAFEVLKNIIKIIEQNLKINIYETFSSRVVKLPAAENFLTIEIFSSSEEKILINITAYTPQEKGASSCKELTRKTIEILNNSKIENLTEIAMQNVVYDRAKKTYLQKCKVAFKMPKQSNVKIKFGNEEILAKKDLTLKFSRNITIYHSQISGEHIQDLGRSLRKVYGSAMVKKDQFQRLSDIILKGLPNKLTVEGQSFDAILTNLERKTKDEIFFSFLEVV